MITKNFDEEPKQYKRVSFCICMDIMGCITNSWKLTLQQENSIETWWQSWYHPFLRCLLDSVDSVWWVLCEDFGLSTYRTSHIYTYTKLTYFRLQPKHSEIYLSCCDERWDAQYVLLAKLLGHFQRLKNLHQSIWALKFQTVNLIKTHNADETWITSSNSNTDTI